MTVLRLDEIAAAIGAELSGDPARTVRGISTLAEAAADQLTFFSNRRYKAAFLASKAGAIILGRRDRELTPPAGAAILWADDAYLAFAKAQHLFHPQRRPAAGIDPRAVIDPAASIDPTASIGALCYVGPGVTIGPRAVLLPSCVVLEGATIAEDAWLWPGVVVRERCVVGPRVIVQPGAVIGGDGFGFAFDPDGPDGMRHLKIPQAGRVVLEEDVEIGANTTIDRGTIGDTLVGRGAKIDNLVQLAHNVEVGALSLIAAQSAVAGSTKLGLGVVCGGQVGIIGHLHIGHGAKFAARSGIAADVPDGAEMGGYPAVPQADYLKQIVASRRMYDELGDIRKLERRIAALEAALAAKGNGP